MEQELAGLDSVLGYVDDLLVIIQDQADHDRKLRNVKDKLVT